MDGSKILAIAIVLAALIVCCGMIAGGALMRGGAPPPQVKVEIPENLASPTGAGMLAVVEPGRIFYLDNSGRIFDVAVPSGGAPRIRDVFTVTYEPRRNAASPESRAIHGYYLDSLSGESSGRIEAAKTAFLGAAAGRDIRLATAAAESLAELGEYKFLIVQLNTPGYAGKSAAALSLGKRGCADAVPALILLLRDANIEIRAAAAEHLQKISGQKFVEDIRIEAQESAISKYTDWWDKYRAEKSGEQK